MATSATTGNTTASGLGGFIFERECDVRNKFFGTHKQTLRAHTRGFVLGAVVLLTVPTMFAAGCGPADTGSTFALSDSQGTDHAYDSPATESELGDRDIQQGQRQGQDARNRQAVSMLTRFYMEHPEVMESLVIDLDGDPFGSGLGNRGFSGAEGPYYYREVPMDRYDRMYYNRQLYEIDHSYLETKP